MTLRTNDGFSSSLAQMFSSFAPLKINLYTGPQPDSPDSAATGTLIVAMPLDATLTLDTTGGIVMAESTASPATSAGTAGWARLFDGPGTMSIDVSAGVSGTDLILNTDSFVLGGAVSIISLTFGFATP